MQTDRQPSFCLVDEPWIPVVYTDGSVGELSLGEVYGKAHQIREISGDLPQQTLPILRLLLAIMYRTFDVAGLTEPEMQEEWAALFERGSFDSEPFIDYLSEWRDRFFLFHPEFPFEQVAGLEYVKGDPSPIGQVIADIVPSPDKLLFSMRAGEGMASIGCAEAARWLLFIQAYDTAGIKSPVKGNTHINKGKIYAPKSAIKTGWLGSIGGVYVQGKNLFETLLYNWVLFDGRSRGVRYLGNDEDLPPWERPASLPDMVEVQPTGPVSRLTWQSRRVRLVLDSEGRVTGIVVCYGDVTYAPDSEDLETMTAWRESPTQQKKLGLSYVPWMPLTHDPDKALWRGLASLLAVSAGGEGKAGAGRVDLRPGVIRWMSKMWEYLGREDRTWPVSIRAQGMSYGKNDSVFKNGIDDGFDFDASLARDDSPATNSAVEVISATEKAVTELGELVRRIDEAMGDKRRKEQAEGQVKDVYSRAFSELDGLFRDRLSQFTPDKDVDEFCADWRRRAHRILRAIADDYVTTTDALLFVDHSERGVSVPSAMNLFARALNKILGPLREVARDDEGEDE